MTSVARSAARIGTEPDYVVDTGWWRLLGSGAAAAAIPDARRPRLRSSARSRRYARDLSGHPNAKVLGRGGRTLQLRMRLAVVRCGGAQSRVRGTGWGHRVTNLRALPRVIRIIRIGGG